jgi:hypothetical protein
MNNLAKLTHARKRWAYLLLLLLHVAARACAQQPDELDPAGGALATATAARTESPWLVLRNPGALAWTAGRTALLSGAPPPAALPGLAQGCALVLLPLDSAWRAGMEIQGSGIASYREVATEVLAAAEVLPGIGFGAGLPVRTLAIERYGASAAVDITVGMVARLTPSIRIGGAVLHTLTSPRAALEQLDRLAFGAALDLSGDAVVSIDVAEQLRRPASVAIGISGRVLATITLRGGISSSPAEITGGFSLDHGTLSVDYAALYRFPLGLRHVIGAGLRW